MACNKRTDKSKVLNTNSDLYHTHNYSFTIWWATKFSYQAYFFPSQGNQIWRSAFCPSPNHSKRDYRLHLRRNLWSYQTCAAPVLHGDLAGRLWVRRGNTGVHFTLPSIYQHIGFGNEEFCKGCHDVKQKGDFKFRIFIVFFILPLLIYLPFTHLTNYLPIWPFFTHLTISLPIWPFSKKLKKDTFNS